MTFFPSIRMQPVLQDKILIVGAADLKNTEMFLNMGVSCHQI